MFFAFFLLIAGGCGSGQIAVVHTTGTVTHKGQPLTRGKVVFRPSSGPEASGALDGEGKFSLSTYGSNDGAVVGAHSVYLVPDIGGVILTPGESHKPAAKPTVEIPPQYQSPATSGWQAEVTAKGENSFSFEVK